MKIVVTFTLSLVLFCTVFAQTDFPKARVTARFVDEGGLALSGVKVTFIFGSATNANAIVSVRGVTGADGMFSAEGHSDGGYGVRIEKEGYYESGLAAPRLQEIQGGRWLPWDPVVTTTLRKIGQSVPLHAKIVRADVPLLDRNCGYDLEKGDWVSPHGKGVTSDLIFQISKRYTDRFDFSVKARVSFSNTRDGLVRMKAPDYARYSSFRWERFAPEDGYRAPHVIDFSNFHPGSGKSPERSFRTDNEREEGFFLRVRTVEEGGRIVSANYGKIVGDIMLEPRDTKTCAVMFTYYFNPAANDHNLEWDPARNFFSSLEPQEAPRWP